MLLSHRTVQHRGRAIVALLVLMLAVLAIAACGDEGDGGGGSSSDAETLLTQTFAGSQEIRSGRADVQLRVLLEGEPSLRGPIEIGITGPFASAGTDRLPRFDLKLDAHAQGQGIEAGLTSTSDRLFVRFGGTAYAAPAELMRELRDSYARSQQEGSSQKQMNLAGLGIDPMSWLKDPKVEGTESVGGVETEHVTAQLDVPALLDDVDAMLAEIEKRGLGGASARQVPDRLPADTRAQIEEAFESGTVDVWTGTDDHILRRLAVDLRVELPEEDDGPSSVDLSLIFTLTEVNEPQTIEAPATSRPLDELLGQLQGLLGGALGGAGGLGGSGSGSSGGASQQQLDAYTRCIQDAGADVARAQQCASLLTP